MFPRFRRKVPTPKDETEPKTSTAWKLVGGATGQVAKLVVDAAGIAANMCPLPGVAAIPEALKLIQETMEEAKNNMVCPCMTFPLVMLKMSPGRVQGLVREVRRSRKGVQKTPGTY